MGGSYSDSYAVHFASEAVADAYYGCERSNEIFIAFPSALIITEYDFRGSLNNPTGYEHNDTYVWSREHDGMDINAGVVFIPRDTMVSVENGSRYKIDGSDNPVKRIDYIKDLETALENNDFRAVIEKIREETSTGYFDATGEGQKSFIEKYKSELRNTFSLDQGLVDILMTPTGDSRGFPLGELRWSYIESWSSEERDVVDAGGIEDALFSVGELYEKPETLITAEEYWESYFKRNPGKKPSKVVYYEGDPTEALRWWQLQNGIIKNGDEKYPQRSAQDGDIGQTVGLTGSDRFRTLVEPMIHEYFERKRAADTNSELTG